MSSHQNPNYQSSRVLFRPEARQFVAPPAGHDDAVLAFHRRLPGYAATPLRAAPSAAARLGVGEVWVKDESSRMGLPAYKILGASWATYRALETRFGAFAPWTTVHDLADQLRPHGPLTLVAATDGNHGRAVARMARWLGLSAHILVPQDMVSARRSAIESEGARLSVVDGSYDDAVLASARLQGERHLLISDTAWDGYEQVPGWVVEGYATLHRETDDQRQAQGAPPYDLVAVQMGVGSLAASAVRHYRQPGSTAQIVGVEPDSADCVLRSVEAGRLTEVPGPHPSVMAGLNCGLPSTQAWPLVSRGLSAYVAIADTYAEGAVQLLAQDSVNAGESGAAGLGGLLALLTGPGADAHRSRLGVNAASRLLVLSTEGSTG